MMSCLFFFFKQKTAYEMRISDWSSDVCSSDLLGPRGINVNAVAPGATKTDFIAFLLDNKPFVEMLESQTALGRLGTPEDIADVVAFLASDAARWVTGARLRASGGMQL